MAVLLIALVIGGVSYYGLSNIQLSPTTPVIFDQSTQLVQTTGTKCWSGQASWLTVPVSTCSSSPTLQSNVNPASNNTGLSLSLASLWANGLSSGANGVNIGAVAATLGSSTPGANGLSALPLCTVPGCIAGGGYVSGSGTAPTPVTYSCQSPQAGFSTALFCPPNSLPVSNYQLAVSQNGAVQRLDRSSFTTLYSEPVTRPYITQFSYTTRSGNFTTTQNWLMQRYGIDIRLQIQGDQIQIVSKCAFTGTVALLGSTWGCPQILSNAGAIALQFINQYDKATGFITLDVAYPGIPVQQGEVDDFIGAWVAGSSCLFSASTTANSPVVNGAVAPPGGGSVSVPVCIQHNAVPYAPNTNCAPGPGQLNFNNYNNATPLPPLAGLCSAVKLQLKINSFGPNYQLVPFNTQGGGDVQGTNCYTLVSANQQAGTQPGCDWGVRFDQGMILDIPIMFDYMSYYTTRTALNTACGAACGGAGTGQGSGTGGSSPGPQSTGSLLTVNVVDFIGLPVTGATVSLTAGSGQSTGPNPCTSGTSGIGQCQFNVLPGTWTVTAAENGYSIPILGFSIQFPPLDNVATAQIVVQPGNSAVTLAMGLNLQGGFVLAGFIIGIAFILVIVWFGIKAASSRSQTALNLVGAAKRVTGARRK